MESHIGLGNLGNTCYMNSVLQCLYYIKFKEKLMKDIYQGNLIEILQNLFRQLDGGYRLDNLKTFVYRATKDLRKNELIIIKENELEYHTMPSSQRSQRYNTAIYPKDLKNFIDRKINKFNGYETHDCADFLVNMLDLLKKETNLVNLFLIEMKIVSQISHFKESYETSCLGLNKRKIKTSSNTLEDCDKSFFLDIPLKSFKSDLKSCILEYMKPKQLSGNVQGQEWKSFLNLPDILVINLRRINKNYYNSNFIEYQEEIDLSELIEPKGNTISNYQINGYKNFKTQKYNYKLKAFIVHLGHPLGGHKIAICYDEKDYNWYSFDDHNVDFCENPFNQKVAFLFFYEKIG